MVSSSTASSGATVAINRRSGEYCVVGRARNDDADARVAKRGTKAADLLATKDDIAARTDILMASFIIDIAKYSQIQKEIDRILF